MEIKASGYVHDGREGPSHRRSCPRRHAPAHWKEFDDPAPGKPGALLRLSFDGGATWPEFVTVARHPEHRMAYWDQRLAAHPETGQLVAMFWTHDFDAGQDADAHIAWGSGTRGSTPTCGATWRAGASAIPAWPCCRRGRSSSSTTREAARSRAHAGRESRWSRNR